MFRAAAILATSIVLALPAAGQIKIQPAASGTGSISGRVIDLQTGSPIAGARVNLGEMTPRMGVYGRYDSTKTDDGGRFAFRELPASQFDLMAGAPDYLDGAAGRHRPAGSSVLIKLAQNEVFTNLTIELTRAARIRGRVLDESGQPVAGVPVQAWRRDMSRRLETPSRLIPSATTTTDGTYEIRDVPPGDYVVVLPVTHATRRVPLTPPPDCGPPPPPPPPGTVLLPRPPAPLEPRRVPGATYSEMLRGYRLTAPATRESGQTFATTFYPGATEPALASTITLNSGDARTNVDFRLESVPATTVRGRLVRPSGKSIGPGTAVTLRRAGASATYPDQELDATAFVDEDRRFTFLDVPAGHYTLEVELAISAGSCDVGPVHLSSDVPTRMSLDVPADGIEDLIVPAGEGFELDGQIIFHGSGARPYHVDLSATSDQDRRTGASTGDGERFMGDGERFTISGLTPGRWTLRASDNAVNSRWYVESMTLDGHDLTAEPFVVGNSNGSGLVVTMTNQLAALTGEVFDAQGRRVDDATVVAFPVDRRLWAGAQPNMMRFPTARALGGRYEFKPIMAGEYVVVAVDERRMDDWPKAAFLETIQSRAPRVRVTAGEQMTLALTMR